MPAHEPEDTELGEIYDFLLKFILIGDSGVGKSCLLHHFLNNRFRDPSQHTIGVEFSSTLLRLPSSSSPSGRGASSSSSALLKIQIWDTAGSERFKSLTRNYFRGACGAVLVYDITNRETFTNLKAWLTDARALASPDLHVVLVGNKIDQEEQRQVSFQEASEWSKENDLLYLETSSLTGENVEQPFHLLARAILLAIESGKLDPSAAGSGVSFGERTLRRVNSWGSRRSSGGIFFNTSSGRKCC